MKENTGPELFDLQVIMAATDNFSESNKLGRGGFGSVYKVISLSFPAFECAVEDLKLEPELQRMFKTRKKKKLVMPSLRHCLSGKRWPRRGANVPKLFLNPVEHSGIL